MLIAGFPAGSLAANCYLVAPAAGGPCVVVDPGQDAAPGVARVLAEHDLSLAGVLLTHGHADHVWDAAAVCAEHVAPAWIHPADRHLLTDPAAGVSAQFADLLAGVDFREPADVRDLVDGEDLEVAGLRLRISHAPGHTPGSVLISVDYDDDPAVPALCFAGDVLFAGSIGRTDLPGGDHDTMLRSLAQRVLPMDDRVVVLPGHGGQTSIGRERAGNPFLADPSLADLTSPEVGG